MIANALIDEIRVGHLHVEELLNVDLGRWRVKRAATGVPKWIILAAAPRFGGSALAPSRAAGFRNDLVEAPKPINEVFT